jgi:hypothetical protein
MFQCRRREAYGADFNNVRLEPVQTIDCAGEVGFSSWLRPPVFSLACAICITAPSAVGSSLVQFTRL